MCTTKSDQYAIHPSDLEEAGIKPLVTTIDNGQVTAHDHAHVVLILDAKNYESVAKMFASYRKWVLTQREERMAKLADACELTNLQMAERAKHKHTFGGAQ